MTQIRIAHSPDADDAYMFYGLIQGKVPMPEGLELVDVKEDIESLNQKALKGEYEVTAISFHAYPHISDKYYLLTTGACFGDQYGPIIVTSKSLKPKQILKARLAIPGKMTSAFLALKLYEHHLAGEAKSGICYTQVPFDEIQDQVAEKKVDAGLIIHEGQLSYEEKGLHKFADLGVWWHEQTGFPLPLGGIAVRRDLGHDKIRQIGEAIQKSIQYGLDHREEALAYALPFARGMDAERAQKFIGMYVNDYTIDFGRTGFKAIKTFLDRGYREGILKEAVDFEDCVFDVKKGRVKPGLKDVTLQADVEAAPEVPSEVPSEPAETTDPDATQKMTEETPLT